MIEYYKTNFDFDSFEFWSGAANRLNNATEEQRDAVKERLEEFFDGEIPTDGQINDVVWFMCDDIFFPETEEDEEENDA